MNRNIIGLGIILLLIAIVSTLSFRDSPKVEEEREKGTFETWFGEVLPAQGKPGLVLTTAGSVAEDLGLRAGDVLLSYNSQDFRTKTDFLNFLKIAPKETVLVKILRESEVKSIKVVPSEMTKSYKEHSGYKFPEHD